MENSQREEEYGVEAPHVKSEFFKTYESLDSIFKRDYTKMSDQDLRQFAQMRQQILKLQLAKSETLSTEIQTLQGEHSKLDKDLSLIQKQLHTERSQRIERAKEQIAQVGERAIENNQR